MSLQVFLQAKLLGAEQFLGIRSRSDSHTELGSNASLGRCAWLTLLCEVVPRALLAELKLSRMLLGSSSAEQFLLVLAEEDIPRANQFLTETATAIEHLSENTLRLVWASTENLGAWPVVRKRLDDALQTRIAAPLSSAPAVNLLFEPFEAQPEVPDLEHYFAKLSDGLPSAKRVGFSSSEPASLVWDAGQHNWPLIDRSAETGEDAILFPRPADAINLADFAARANGSQCWGVLRGDVDSFDTHLRSANTVEEHIHFSVLFKEFFAGELSRLTASGDLSRKAAILYRGGDDFAVAGAWDSLVLIGRELERLFEKFVQQNSQFFPGLEARTISMALTVATDVATPLSAVLSECGADLRRTKALESGAFHLFGRSLEWKRLADAEELKSALVRLVDDFRFPAGFVHDLASVCRESFTVRASRRGKLIRADKPWRAHMRISAVIPQARGKELNNIRNTVIASLVGKRAAGLKLRPSARVGLEWARLAVAAT